MISLSGIYWKLAHFLVKIGLINGIFLFVLLGSPCKNLKSYDNSFLEIEQMAGEREREIMPSLIATSLRWRTHSARTNERSIQNTPICKLLIAGLATNQT